MAAGAGTGPPSDPAVVGRVLRPHGLRGEVVVAPLDASSTTCEVGNATWLAGRWRRVGGLRRDNKGRWVVRFEGVDTHEAAEALRGAEMAVDAAELPQLDEGRYYIHDLVGCRVLDVEGTDLGEVVAVVPGPQDWLEVEHDGGRSLVPMVQALLKDVDVCAGRIVIDPPHGLVDATFTTGRYRR